MPPLTLEGDTLGQKHQHFNKLVRDAVGKQTTLTNINYDDDDIENLMKIDIAVRNKNVDYILEVLKSEDMLYVSRALKRSAWLATEPQYAHIINPQYLHQHLFPHMTTKAINKLILHIKLNLKEEKRVEEFYDYVKEHKSVEVLSWLQNCSLSFVENVLKDSTRETRIPLHLYKRLCRRSFNFVKYYENVNTSDSTVLKAVSFLLNNHTQEYLDLLDTVAHYSIPNIDAKYTEVIMKKCPHRIINNFEKYAHHLNLSIVAKYIKKDEIKDFVLKHIANTKLKHLMTDYDNLKHFVKYLPKEDRHEFVKYIFVGKEAPSESGLTPLCSLSECFMSSTTNSYRWYQYAPFSVAFKEMKKLIRAESAPAERLAMLEVLVKVSRHNPEHLHTVLQYYEDKHGNEPFKFKIQFINNVVTQIAVHKLDERTWSILDQLFHSVDVYTESDKNVQTCVKCIILYKVINGHNIPVIIEKKFIFDTLNDFQSTLDEEQKDKLYTFLLHYIITKLHNEKINDESQFRKYIDLLEQALNLLKHWKKDISDHPLLLEKIQQVISVKQENSWNTELSPLYNMNKKWRRQMFSLSLSLCASEETCLNALKHEPRLLARHGAELNALRAADRGAVPRRLLAKLRIYWPHTIAKEWTDEYSKGFNETTGHKALINGLFILLPQKRAEDIARKYVPNETKIKWGHIDQRELSIRKNIAQYLHMTRPQSPLDVVLSYAKGDFLQYAVPSLNSILHNSSKIRGREHIPKILDAPVSLQKYGISFAFDKLESDELRPVFLNIWKNTKNSSIRAILFTCTHKMLCKVKDSAEVKDIWLLLSSFIDNLSNEENKQIYYKLGQVENIPLSVRAEFYMKSYKLLKSLPAKNNCESTVDNLVNYAPKIMDILDPDFVTDHLLASIEKKFSAKEYINNDVITTFVFYGRSVEDQLRRFDKVLLPIMARAIQTWDVVTNDTYWSKNFFKDFTRSSALHFKGLIIKKRIHVPVKLFGAIKNLCDEKMGTQEKYLVSTYWKLAETYAKLVNEHKSIMDNEDEDMSALDYDDYYMSSKFENIWDKMYVKILPIFGSMCLQYLKEDVENYFPSIYSLFAVALEEIFQHFLYRKTLPIMETLKHMLGSEDCIQSYIMVCERIPRSFPTHINEEEAKRTEIRKILSLHPSEEVQMHLHLAFRDTPHINQ